MKKKKTTKRKRTPKRPTLLEQLAAQAVPLLGELERKTGLLAEQMFAIKRCMERAADAADEPQAAAKEWGLIQIEMQTSRGPHCTGVLYDWQSVEEGASGTIAAPSDANIFIQSVIASTGPQVKFRPTERVTVTRIDILAFGAPAYLEQITLAGLQHLTGPVVSAKGLHLMVDSADEILISLAR